MGLKDDLIRDEGKIPYAYQDSLGYWTIGVGHLIDKRLGGRLPDSIIDVLLDWDIAEVSKELYAKYPWVERLDPVRRDVLLNMAFNLGVDRLSKFINTLGAFQEGRWADAARGMRQSLWAKQVGARAERLARRVETGKLENESV